MKRQTLSIIVNPHTYQRLQHEVGRGKISQFVEELIIKALDNYEERLAIEREKLIRGYQAMAKNKKLKEELAVWEETLEDGSNK